MFRLEPAFAVSHNDCVHRIKFDDYVLVRTAVYISNTSYTREVPIRTSSGHFFLHRRVFAGARILIAFEKKLFKVGAMKNCARYCSGGLSCKKQICQTLNNKNLATNKAQKKVLFLDVEKSFREMKSLLLDSSAPCARERAATSRQRLHDMRRWSDNLIMAPERPCKSNQSSGSRNLHAIFFPRSPSIASFLSTS